MGSLLRFRYVAPRTVPGMVIQRSNLIYNEKLKIRVQGFLASGVRRRDVFGAVKRVRFWSYIPMNTKDARSHCCGGRGRHGSRGHGRAEREGAVSHDGAVSHSGLVIRYPCSAVILAESLAFFWGIPNTPFGGILERVRRDTSEPRSR